MGCTACNFTLELLQRGLFLTNPCFCAENSPAWLPSLGICGLAGARSFRTDLWWLEFPSWPLKPLLQRCGNPQAAPKHSEHDCL